MPEPPLETAFRLQAGACRHLGSPLYGALMQRALEDVRAGGALGRFLRDFLEAWGEDPLRGFVPLRLFGAVHGLVLSGDAPALAAHYPSAGGDGDAEAAWPAFLDTVHRHAARVRRAMERFPQTNEVRRCAGLLGGFLELDRRTERPLRLREIGCSAGLNLLWDRYRYALGPHRWGDPASPVRIEADWEGPPPALARRPRVESRAGCDVAPRPVTDDAAVRALEAFVWPDQPERLVQLRAAVRTARAHPPRVERARAAAWLEAELARDPEGTCTVLFHSAVWAYLPVAEQARIRALMDDAGARATARRPLAWLRHEDTGTLGRIEVRLRLWPDGTEWLLGHGHPHGRRVEWLAAPRATRPA